MEEQIKIILGRDMTDTEKSNWEWYINNREYQTDTIFFEGDFEKVVKKFFDIE